jgi:DNA-binding MarR family transcriptional regulator
MSEAGPIAFELLTEVGIIDQLATARLEAVLPDGLLAPHFGVLNHLARLGDGVSPVVLSRAFQVAKPTMTNTLQRLEARGFIQLVPDPADRRGKRVLLTDAGRNMRDNAVTAAVAQATDLRAHIGDDELAEILPTLRRLRAALDATRRTRGHDRRKGAEGIGRSE